MHERLQTLRKITYFTKNDNPIAFKQTEELTYAFRLRQRREQKGLRGTQC